ncbi:MAG: hypothetical protein LAO20_08885 [Acidobacteriia bacterium]|nr:hypothetical protein [Terriglobia bacterium]
MNSSDISTQISILNRNQASVHTQTHIGRQVYGKVAKLSLFVVAPLVLFAISVPCAFAIQNSSVESENGPVISWIPASSLQTVSPGETGNLVVHFVSTKNLGRVVVQTSPELTGLVQPQPARLENVRKGEIVEIVLHLAPAANATLGNDVGTLSLIKQDDGVSHKALLQPFPLSVRIWKRFSTSVGLSFQYPPEYGAVPDVKQTADDTRVNLFGLADEFPLEGITISRRTDLLVNLIDRLKQQLTLLGRSSQTVQGIDWTILTLRDEPTRVELYEAVTERGGVVLSFSARNTAQNTAAIQLLMGTTSF